MFSSFANLLPAALTSAGNGNANSASKPALAKLFTPDPPSDDEDHEQEPPPTAQPAKKEKEKEKEKQANESFIFVRPPPSKSNHPLNLQVQLVPPNTRNINRKQSGELQTPTQDASLTLARSRSDVSYTYSGSTASFASFTSTSTGASTASGRRAIVPLYSLQAHNVMTNVIVDAGTDAKIAKFQKRGLELIDLAFLEPVEVWPEQPSQPHMNRASVDEVGYALNQGPSRGSTLSARSGPHHSAASSAVSLNSTTNSHSHVPSNSVYPQSTLLDSQSPTPMPTSPVVAPSTANSKRNLFGKLFNKRPSTRDSSAPANISFTFGPDAALVEESTPPSPHATPRAKATHTRNHSASGSISASLAPIKSNFRSNKNRLSAALHGDSDLEDTSAGRLRSSRTLSVSPSASALRVGAGEDGDGNHAGLLHPTDYKSGRKEKEQLRPPVLGIQPTFVTAPVPSPSGVAAGLTSSTSGNTISNGTAEADGNTSVVQLQQQKARALMYVWLVKRWMKRTRGEGIMGYVGGVGDKISEIGHGLGVGNTQGQGLVQGQVVGMGVGGVEVRFEWKRGKAKRKRRKQEEKTQGKRLSDQSNATKSEDPEDAGERGRAPRDGNASNPSPSKQERESSTRRETSRKRRDASRSSKRRSASISVSTSDGYDDGEDSDPEDSETPWVCTLKVRRGVTFASGAESVPSSAAPGVTTFPVDDQQQVIRIKVGTLSPTPHHPKVVAMLKVPFPLPDVLVERGVVRRRAGAAPGTGAGSETYTGLTLTAEEIKDVVCSTGLWLVVREAFGGVGRVSRKGDGWRIRA